MRRTMTRLSDGRELIYFDRDDASARTASDERDLPANSTEQGTMRFDPLTGEWISIAGHRQTRIFLPDAAACPLCPTTPGNLSEIPESTYDVVVFENRFPSFLAGASAALDEGIGAQAPAYGRCEVVAFSQDHGGSIGELDDEGMRLVLAAWIDRTRVLGELPGIRYVFAFENRGADVGVTLHHPHGQIYAYPFVPPAIARLHHQCDLAARRGTRLLDDVVAFELDQHERIVYRDDHWVAFVPFAARWPYEVQIHPITARASLTDLDDLQRESFVASYPRLIRALDTIFEGPFPYMAGWHQLPAHPTADELRDSRLFLRVISNRRAADKLKYLAGSESLMGAFIGDVVPEVAAATMRDAWERTP